MYQFEEPRRRDILRNINRGITPPITGTIWPGAVPLLNTKAELDRLYALVAQESDEQNSPNTRLGQKFIAWLNRYMGDADCVMGKKPPKTNVIIHALKKWRPPVWASARGKSKHNGYKQAHQAQRDQLDGSTSQPPASIPETAQPPATSTHHPPTPEAVQPPATSSSFAPAPATASTRMFGVVSTIREPTPAPVPLLILTRQQRTTHKQDGLPKGAPSWGDKSAEWHDFVHHLSWAGFTGVSLESATMLIPSTQSLRLTEGSEDSSSRGTLPLVSNILPTATVGAATLRSYLRYWDDTELSSSEKGG